MFRNKKSDFALPENVIYLDGNSLGPLPKAVPSRLQNMVQDEWGKELIRAWNSAGWMSQTGRVANKISRIVGAADNTITMGDTLSIKLFQALSAGLKLRPKRRVVLSDSGNFPSDLYVAQGLLAGLGDDYTLRVVAPEEVMDAIDETVAVVMLTEVDYRTARRHDMMKVTEKAHRQEAVMLWDLAHSTGAVPLSLSESNCEFAVGCTYKYLNGGPGAPAFLYARPDILEQATPILTGWLGHAAPFDFQLDYQPANSIERFRVGTPSVAQMTMLDTALEIYTDVNMHDLSQESQRLMDIFIAEIEAKIPDFRLTTPRAHEGRGSHVSFCHEAGYAIMQAVIEAGVIGDFRAPDIMRFAVTPLYIGEDDLRNAAEIMKTVYDSGIWQEPRFQTRNAVT